MENKKIEIVNLCIKTPSLDEVWLINRIKAPYRGYWGMPGGKVKDNESSDSAAVRELFEETGIEHKIKNCSGKYWELIYENEDLIYNLDISFFEFITKKDISNYNSGEGILKKFKISEIRNNSSVIPSDPYMLDSFLKEYSEYRGVISKNLDNYKLIEFSRMK